MSLSAIPRSLRRHVFQRDNGRCQYCQLAQHGQASVFHINHIVPKSKGGPTDEANLVLQCPWCSLHKSDQVSGRDPVAGDITALFHPLKQRWADHFVLVKNGVCHGTTPTGRVTVEILQINDPLPRTARAIQVRFGLLKTSTI